MSADSKRSCLIMFADCVKTSPRRTSPAATAKLITTQLRCVSCRARWRVTCSRCAPSSTGACAGLCQRNAVVAVQLDRIDRKGKTRFADLDLAQWLIDNAPNDDLPSIALVRADLTLLTSSAESENQPARNGGRLSARPRYRALSLSQRRCSP